MNGNKQGFTLVELMIVVAIIAIILAIAIPNLASSKDSAELTSAIADLRTISSVNTVYRSRFGQYASALDDLYTAGYIDENLGLFPYKGVVYARSGEEWEANHWGMYIDETGVLYAGDPDLGGAPYSP